MTTSLPPPPPRPPSLPSAVIRSSRSTVWIGVTLALLGVVLAIVWGVSQFVLFTREVGDLRRADEGAPLVFEVSEPVGWTLFLEPDSASLGGVRFAVVDVATETSVALGRYDGSFSYATPSRRGRAIATVSVPAGTYRLVVEGPVTIAIGPSPASRFGWMIGGAAAIGAPLLLGGGVLAAVSAIRDTRRRTQAAQSPPPSPWTAGEWPQEPPG